jgi:hypothetical protein
MNYTTLLTHNFDLEDFTRKVIALDKVFDALIEGGLTFFVECFSG